MPLPTLPADWFSREFLRIGGGYNAPATGTSPAGGLDIDNAGNLATNGGLTIAQELLLGGVITLPIQDRTIASDQITVTSSFVRVAAESGTSDNLATILGGTTGTLLLLRPSGSHIITLKHATGNILCPAATDLVLQFRRVIMVYDASAWNILVVQA